MKANLSLFQLPGSVGKETVTKSSLNTNLTACHLAVSISRGDGGAAITHHTPQHMSTP